MTDKGKAGKRTRIIKQVLSKDGKITKASKVVKPANYDVVMMVVSNIRRIYQRHLAIRNWIIVILIIINLLSWSH